MPAEKKMGEVKKSLVSSKAETKKPVKEAKKKTPPKLEKPEPAVSFAYWFRSKRFKPHWAAGMQAYTDTTRRRTVADWNRLFESY